MVDPARAKIVEFAGLLEGLRRRAGEPSVRWLEKWAPRDGDGRPGGQANRPGFTRATINDKLNAKSRPDDEFVRLFVRGCAAYAQQEAIRLPDWLIAEKLWSDRLSVVLEAVESEQDNARRSAEASEELRRRSVPRQLPPVPRHFVGREAQSAALTSVLARAGDRGHVPLVAITGAAGSGKTSLAVRWAHHNAGSFPDGQIYVNLRGHDGVPVDPAAAVRNVLEALGEQVPADATKQVGQLRTVLSDKSVLLILDNAAGADQVRPLLPAAPGCLVLVTSRDSLASLVGLDGAYALPLPLLTAEEARRLLAERLGEPAVDADPDASAQVIAGCAGLPLALNIVAALAAGQPSLRPVTEALAEARHRLDVLTLGDPASNLRAVFQVSYARLSDPAARLFRLLGVHPGPAITTVAAASLLATHPDDTFVLVSELISQHLLEERLNGQYSFHDLLRDYAAELANTTDNYDDRRAAVRRALDHYLHTADAAGTLWDPHRGLLTLPDLLPGVVTDELLDAAAGLGWLRRQYPTLLRAVQQAYELELDTYAWQLVWTMRDFLHRHGYWHDLAAVSETALRAAERLDDPAAKARLHRILGRLGTALDQAGDSSRHSAVALALFEALGDRSGQAHTHLDISIAFAHESDFTAARESARRAATYYAETGDTVGEANALNGVGWYSTLLGDHAGAVEQCGRALALLRELGDRTGQAATMDSLGLAYFHLGDLPRADEYLSAAIAIFAETTDPVEQAGSLTRLGDVRLAMGDPQGARGAWEQAKELFESLDDATSRDEVAGKLDDLP